LISPDILAITAGGNVGTGLEGTVKGGKALFTTRTANNIIFDVYAVRRDVLDGNPTLVEAFRAAHLREQESFLSELANVAKKSAAERQRVDTFKKLCRPLSRLFLQDEGAVNDYIVWAGVDSQLAGYPGNLRFFDESNPVGLTATTTRIQRFFAELGLVNKPVTVAFYTPPVERTSPPAKTPAVAKTTFRQRPGRAQGSGKQGCERALSLHL
jgi:hypothetical protein